MKHNLRALGALACIAVAATTFVSQAQAAPVMSISLTPATDVAYGGAVGADIFVTGLGGQAVGGYQFVLNYDSSRMTFSNYLVNPDAKLGAAPFDTSFGDLGGTVDFLILADASITEPDLVTLQGGAFRLGHVDFNALNNAGFADFSLSFFGLSEYDGATAIGGVTSTGARLCVSATGTGPCDNNVPEPMSALLVGVALGGLALTRRKSKAAA